MRVLQVIDSLDPGGAERVCVNLANLLHQKGIQVSILTITNLGDLATLLSPSIQVKCLGRKYKFDLGAMAESAKLLRQHDIIHVHMRYTYQYVRLVATLFFINKKILLHDHYGMIEVDQAAPVVLRTVFKPQYYIGVSSDLTNWSITKLNINPTRVFLLENTVMRVPHSHTDIQDTAVIVSNFNRIKNHLFAIQVIEKSNRNLVIYGKVLDEGYFQEVKNYVFEHGLEGRVKFIHDENNIQHHLGKYSFGLHTALSESGPLVLIEYLAQSIPFLAYETGQVARKIKNDLPEFFLCNFDLEEWQAQIDKALHVNRSYLLLVYNKYFDSEIYLAKCLEIYDRILGTDL